MGKSFDLLALGEVLLRLSPPANDRITSSGAFQKKVGGAELNVVSGASLLGLRTGIISKLPDHALGTFVRKQIRFSGVSDDYLINDKSEDARLGVYYYENGAYPRKPSVVYDRKHTSMERISLDEFPDGLYKGTKCFHTSGITLALCKQSRETAVGMIKRFKENGTLISFDVNFRQNLWSGEEARRCIEEILPFVDVFFCSEETARLTFGKEGDVKEMMKSFCKDYPISVVASTRRIVHSPKIHSFDSIAYSSRTDSYYEDEPYENIEVVDRIGSGDAYVAGALYGLLAHELNCAKAVEYGNATSAMKNTIVGDLPSSDLKEIDGIIKDHKQKGRQSEMNR